MDNKRTRIRFDSFINSTQRIKRIKLNICLINESNSNLEILICLINKIESELIKF